MDLKSLLPVFMGNGVIDEVSGISVSMRRLSDPAATVMNYCLPRG